MAYANVSYGDVAGLEKEKNIIYDFSPVDKCQRKIHKPTKGGIWIILRFNLVADRLSC
jgi:hypothetical protein